ncbi:transcriptional regulator [Mycolicibacterium peregrinum]|uniref:LCP family glycopolymer transferase n=1 Tax=Mycolicibacterium peregrinum TaxID=43304 RepID=UPI0006D81232|nr:LCP family protein [Mycolicibacterium peregrinum]MCV7201363.1 LCP family protein [Mycolicibacterium peregrinum]ORW62201.1 transcriptional regulator [Mycolicibacterium peregrinum]OWM02864.1 transcriptional regulator [Mycolicibacterium peregrinum]
MSDGDNATPGRRRRSPEDSSDNQWITRSREPLPGAAPWERQDAPSPDDSPLDEPTGSHADGVTVADLIAKVAGTGYAPTRHRLEPDEPEPEPEPELEPAHAWDPEPEPDLEPAHAWDPEPDLEPEPEAEPAYAPAYVRPPVPDPTDVIEAVRIDAELDEPQDSPEAEEYPEPFEERFEEPFETSADHREIDVENTDVLPALAVYEYDMPKPRPSWRVRPTSADEDDSEHDRADTDEIERVRPPINRRVMLAGRAAAAMLAVLTLVLTGGAWQWQSSKNNSLNKVAALDLNSRDIVDPNAQFGDENFLIVGTDSRFGENGGMGAGGTEDAGGARSDTIMLVNIPADRRRVVAVSFPRDLSITPMKCEPWNAETATYGPLYDEETETYGPDEVYTETKLNSAFAFGGPKCLVKVIQKLSGLSINRFMAVDFAGFSKMVDALGGIEVCSTTPLEDYELGTVLANAGRQTIDGHTALNYVRARQVTTEYNGDYGRIKRQQLFLSSLLRTLISRDTFFSLNKLNNVVNMFISDSFVDNIRTRDLVDLGQSVQGVNAGRITFVTVPTVGYADEYGNEVPRTDDMRSLFDAIINDDPLPGEKNPDNTPVPGTPESATSSVQAAAPSEASATPSSVPAPAPATDSGEMVNAITTEPQQVTVQVSNSTGQSGLASTAATELQEHGFNVNTPDDYPSTLPATTVFFSPGNEEAAATVASSFTNPTIERVTGMGSVVQVVLGSDFYTVNAPTPSGSEVQVHVLKGTGASPTHLPEDLTVTNAADTTCE